MVGNIQGQTIFTRPVNRVLPFVFRDYHQVSKHSISWTPRSTYYLYCSSSSSFTELLHVRHLTWSTLEGASTGFTASRTQMSYL